MDYKKAKELRGKKFSELMTDKLLDDQGVSEAFRKTLSEKSKARTTGIKEKFDPMNIAKVLTGGSRFGPALLGKMMGRSQEDIEYFAGKPKQGKKLKEGQLNIHKKFELDKKDSSIQVLGLIYREMLRAQEAEKEYLLDEQKKQKDEATWEDKRNKQLIDALRGIGKEPTRKQKKAERRKERKEEKKTEEKKTQEKKTEQKKETQKPTEKAPEKAPPAKEAPKETKTPAKEAPKETPKVEKAPPKEAPKAPEKVPAKEAPKEATKPPPKTETKELPKKPSAEKTLQKPAPSIPTGSDVMSMIKQHEGSIPYPYKDSKGLWTIGVGHLIGNGKSLPPEYDAWKNNGGPYDKKNNKTPAMSPDEIDKLFVKDFEDHKKIAMKAPGWPNANEVGQAALIDLSYNMGAWWTLFKKASAAMVEGDFNKAADELQYKNRETKEPSDWWKQVGPRAVKIVNMVRNGGKESTPGVPTNQSLPATLPPVTGDKIDKSSKENKELKDKKDSSAMQVNNNTNITNKSSSASSTSKPKGDDTNAYQQKVQR